MYGFKKKNIYIYIYIYVYIYTILVVFAESGRIQYVPSLWPTTLCNKGLSRPNEDDFLPSLGGRKRQADTDNSTK